jgi:hypothetical protein
MWELYSKGGIAIKYSIGSIKSALEDNKENLTIHMVKNKVFGLFIHKFAPS